MVEVDVGPGQPAELAGAQPGEDRGRQQRPQSAGMREHRAKLILRRQIDADLQLSLVALLDPGPPAIAACLLAHDVARHLAPGHCLGED